MTDVAFKQRYCHLKFDLALTRADHTRRVHHFSPVQTFVVLDSRRSRMGGLLYRVSDLMHEYWVHADDVDIYELEGK